MKFELNSLPRNCSKEEIIAEIKRVDVIVSKDTLTKKDFDQYGKIHSGTLQAKFGGWQKVLALAGLEYKYANMKIHQQRRSRKFTNDEILSELKRLAKLLNKNFVTIEDWMGHSKICSTFTVINRFGSWVAGLDKAGLKVSNKYHRKYSNEELFENLLNVWTYYGRQPYYDEMTKTPSIISISAYERRFGNWRKALEAFVLRMHSGDSLQNQTSQEEKKSVISTTVEAKSKIVKHEFRVLAEDRKGIGLALRYKILSRDKFKCVKCGTSPATDHICRLHIDHKIPFSKGGKTVLDNLQTLCENCNLGKGNRHLE